jgi:hypothetical protein
VNDDYPLGNPLIFFLVHNIAEINNELKNSQGSNAMKKLRFLTYFLDPKIKETLKPEREKLDGYFHNGRFNLEDVLKIVEIVNDKLYEFGYFAPQQTFRRPK